MLFSAIACNAPDSTTQTTTTTTPPPQLLPHEKVPKPYSHIYLNLDCLGTCYYSALGSEKRGYSVGYRFDTYQITVKFIDKDPLNYFSRVLTLLEEDDNYKTDTLSDDMLKCPAIHDDIIYPSCIRLISENAFIWYDEPIEDCYGVSSIVFTHPEYPYVVAIHNALNGDGLRFSPWPDDSDHIVARMLDPETALEATNEFWEIVFADSTQSPAK